jgi:SAM-dependent methyltransferase
MFSAVKQNKFGFYELANKPTSEELEQYYAETYYPNTYNPKDGQTEYTPDEIEYRNNVFDLRYHVIDSHVQSQSLGRPARMLDVGCGEGWAMQFFLRKGWEVFGVDYNSHAISSQCPECLDYFVAGDIYAILDDLAVKGEKYDCIWLDHVLEHVIEPYELVKLLNRLLSDVGILLIEVPNDFSIVQRTLWEESIIDRPYWVAIPDHLNYFNLNGLDRMMEEAGFSRYRVGCDYPIDFNLFNELTNYVKDPGKGKPSHQARLKIENMLHRISIEKTADLYEILAEMGLGRNITGYYMVDSHKVGQA